MSGKKWPPRLAVTDFTKYYDDDSFWCAGSLSETRGDYISKEEHQAILSEEQRLNAMGQERELALMARVKELEKRLLVARDIIAICLHARQCNAPYGQMEKMPTVNGLKNALAAIDDKQPHSAGQKEA